ncbi:MAG: hypothetical protein EXR86_00335 [Gammaproteobacteria bacterium]|nr:hypothetical protein [Gammaproteobacteria bacterium]
MSRTLGETEAEFAVDSSEALLEVSLALATQARHSLDIVSRHLDPALYDNELFSDALRALVVNTRRAQIRLLILDSAPVVLHGHRVVELAQRLTDFIQIRVPAPQHKEFNEAWLVADNTGYAHRRFSDRYDATVNFAARRVSNSLTKRFEELWNQAQLDSNLRRQHL